MDTIAALSSGQGPAGIAVVRLSGPSVRFALETIAGRVPAPRQADLRRFLASDGSEIDQGLVLYFPGPRSETGEDCGEFHCHGGRAIVASLLNRLTALPGIRIADPGEFTRRAFINGKLDLVQAEALGDLIHAETEAQRRFAIQNQSGAQAALYQSWRASLIELRAKLTASLDFVDEDDVPEDIAISIGGEIDHLAGSIEDHLRLAHRGEIVLDGYKVVIAGLPNAGKSSLLNALAGRHAAIVSAVPGTTRDVIDVTLDIDGYKVVISDTAGLRDDPEEVEAIGIALARSRIAGADLVLEVLDGSLETARTQVEDAIVVHSKADLVHASERIGLWVSTVTGDGIDDIIKLIGDRVRAAAPRQTDVVPSKARHIALLRKAVHALSQARGAGEPELRDDWLRRGADEMGQLVGRVDVEDILGSVFSRFCIGK